MTILILMVLGSVRHFATSWSSSRPSAVSSAESNAKLTVRSNDPRECTTVLACVPCTRRSTNGILHCGLRAQTISSTVGSSAHAGVAVDARANPQNNKAAYFKATCGVDAAGAIATQLRTEVRLADIPATLRCCGFRASAKASAAAGMVLVSIAILLVFEP